MNYLSRPWLLTRVARRMARPILVALSLLADAFSASAATITVNSSADPTGFNPAITVATLGSTVTLRDAVNAANNTVGTHSIIFSPDLLGATISLVQTGDNTFGPSAFLIKGALSIDGGTGGITLTRGTPNDRLRFFYVATSGNLTLKNLTLKGGLARGEDGFGGGGGGAGMGGALVNAGRILLDSTLLSGNTAQGGDALTYYSWDFPLGLGGGLGSGATAGQFGGPRGFGGGGFYEWRSNNGFGYIGGGDAGYGGGAGWAYVGILPATGTPGFGGAGTGFGGGGGGGLGGAIFNYGGTLTVKQSTLAGNTVTGGDTYEGDPGYGLGGAIFNLNGSVEAYNATIAENVVTTPRTVVAGALFSVGDNGVATQSGPVLPQTVARVFLVNSILARSRDGAGNLILDLAQGTANSGQLGGASAQGSFASGGDHNIIERVTPGNFAGTYVSADPLLAPLQYNGGPTLTMAIALSSPACNAITDASAGTVDQRGVARPQKGASDIGAFEQDHELFSSSLSLVSVPPPVAYGQSYAPLVIRMVGTDSSFPMYGTLTLNVSDGTTISQPVSNLGRAETRDFSFNLRANAAGVHSFTVTYTPNNYALPTVSWLPAAIAGSITALRATPVIVPAQTLFGYDGQPKPLQLMVKGIFGESLGSASVTYWHWNGNMYTVLDSAPAEIGDYVYTASWVSTDNNYNSVPDSQGTFQIRDAAEFPLVVNTLADVVDPADGLTSLREAIASATTLGGNQTIVLDPTLFVSGPVTLTLTAGELVLGGGLTKLTVTGPGAKTLTLSGDGKSRIFRVDSAELVLSGLTLAHGNSFAMGGAIQSFGTLTISDCVFMENSGLVGGAIYDGGVSTFRRCTFVGNSAASRGGAVGTEGNLSFYNCTFYGNNAPRGGAAANYLNASVLQFFSCTLTGNSASDFYGAIDGNSRVVTASYSILSGNTAPDGPNTDGTVRDVLGDSNLVDVDPATIFLTGVPIDNGGQTPTIALKPGSVAIDRGTSSSLVLPAIPSTDQRGVPRPLGAKIDTGAYEAANLAVLAPPSVGNLSDTTATLFGEVLSDGYGPITRRGFVFARTTDNNAPALGGPGVAFVEAPGKVGAFQANLNGLATLSSYSFAAFAVNESGTHYSTVVTFQATSGDPDHDGLSTAQEVAFGTDPLSIDTDSDGFNDPTELLSGSDPKSNASVPGSTHIARILSSGPAGGLDLSGTFLYAINVGSDQGAGQAGDARFTADTVPGVSISAPNQITDWFAPSFSGAPDDVVLQSICRSIRWANRDNPDPALRTLKVSLANLVPCRQYKLQLIFADAPGYQRAFDIIVNGQIIVPKFVTGVAQGTVAPPASAAAVVHEFVAAGSTLLIELSGENTPSGFDPNPLLSGITLEEESTGSLQPVPTAPNLPVVTGRCSASVLNAPTALSACAQLLTGTTTDPLTYTFPGIYTVTWTYEDGHGNTASQVQTVVVEDATPPIAPTLPSVSGECHVLLSAPTAMDDCVGAVPGTTTDPLTYNTQGTFIVHWRFDDGHGNVSTAEQTVVVQDTTAPVPPALASIQGECSATVSVPTATDACVGPVAGTTTDPLTYNTQGTFTVHWRFDDGHGNVSTAEQTVIVQDTTAPVPPALASIKGECSATVSVPTATDACVGPVAGTTTILSPTTRKVPLPCIGDLMMGTATSAPPSRR